MNLWNRNKNSSRNDILAQQRKKKVPVTAWCLRMNSIMQRFLILLVIFCLYILHIYLSPCHNYSYQCRVICSHAFHCLVQNLQNSGKQTPTYYVMLFYACLRVVFWKVILTQTNDWIIQVIIIECKKVLKLIHDQNYLPFQTRL